MTFSDHRYLEFEVRIKKRVNIVEFRNPRRINWAVFGDILNESDVTHTGGVESTDDIDKAVTNLEKNFKKALNLSCPRSIIRGKKQEPWWNNDLKILMKKTRKALNAARKKDTDALWQEYKKTRREFKKLLRKSKRETFTDMLCEIETVKDTARLRKIMSKQEHVPGSMKQTTGLWTESAKETLEMLFYTHFPECNMDINLGNTVNGITRHYGEMSSIDELITDDKIEWAIETFGQYKTPGVDGIYPIMLQKSVKLITPTLREIFLGCLKFSYVPQRWREVKVIFIPKAGKIQHSGAKDYRPISLTSFLLKTFERILENHLRNRISSMQFSDSQHAYTRGRSVETALHDLTFGIEESLNYGEYALACFLDIEGAFNNIKSEAIEKALNVSGNEPILNQWIMRVLRTRIIEAELGGETIRARATRGTPQGGVISPTLWILVLNEALLKLKSAGVKVVAYADDLVLLARGKYVDTISDIMEGALSILHKWATECGLGVNPQKTETVLFVGNRHSPSIRLPKLGGTVLNLSDKAKFLGVIFDSKLKWVDNLKERVRKAYAALYSCQKLIGRTWGLKPKLIHWIYTAIVRPTVAHGAVVWWPIVKKITHARYLERVNRVAALSITGARRTTATASLCMLMDMSPLELYVQEHALRTQLRLKQHCELRVRDFGHTALIRKFGYENIVTDYMSPHIVWDTRIETIIPTREYWNNPHQGQQGIDVFTDGSKMTKGTGSGVFCETLKIEHSVRLHDDCSIFQAELYAVLEAARLISMMPIYSSNITIFIDSQAAIKALGNRNIRSSVVSRCRRELQVLTEQHSLKLCWVPGHNDIPGNERADELARRGAESPENTAINGIYPGLDRTYRDIKDRFNNLVMDKWNENPGCKQTKALWKPGKKNSLRALLLMEKADLRKYVGIITGHTNLKSYKKKIGRTSDDLCRWCGDNEVVEDSFHYLCQCPALSRSRFKCFDSYFFQHLEDLSGTNPWKMLKYIKLTKLED